MIGIDAETLELIQSTARQAAGATGKAAILQPPDNDGRYLLLKADGTHELVEKQPPDRRHKLENVEAVGPFVAWADVTINRSPTVWYSQNAVVVVIDDGEDSLRRHRATVELSVTAEFGLLDNLDSSDWMTQKQLISLLRIGLFDCLGDQGEELIRILRTINFGATTSGHGLVEHGRESMGKDLESEIRSEVGPIPESILLSVRVYDDPALITRGTVRCALDIDPGRGVFQFIPIPSEMRKLRDDALDQLGTVLEGATEQPLFRGTP